MVTGSLAASTQSAAVYRSLYLAQRLQLHVTNQMTQRGLKRLRLENPVAMMPPQLRHRVWGIVMNAFFKELKVKYFF